MRRRNSGYPRTSYGRAGLTRTPTTPRSSITRRAILGAVALLTGGGVVELFRSSHHHSATVQGGPSTPLPQRSGGANGGTTAPETSSQPTHRPTLPDKGLHGNGDSTGPHHQHADLHRHGHSHAGGKGHHPHGHDNGKHDGKHRSSGHRSRREEHVSLPAAKVRERSHPIYTVHDVDTSPPAHAIALTIDDGPDPDWTPKVLRLLERHHMQASFCVVGIHADTYPGLIRDIHRAGHAIVNHSYTHVQPFARQSEKRIVAEITKTQRAIERAAKVTPELFRSPGGDWSPFVFRALAAYGLTPLDWDVDPRDWAMPGRKRIQAKMLRGRPGDIVLCHDGGGNRVETVRALRRVLPTWRRRGYTTMPLVLPASAKRPPRQHTPPTTSPSDRPSGGSSSSPTS
ncbi:MAG: polysaccharide deacetylase family protein [Frankiaceae bacterium]|nr:polysaccharide deacetylase family protein [Frankiaceae bacterium]